MALVTISHRGEERVRSGHPWIYKSDVAKIEARGGDVGTRNRHTGPRPRTGVLQRSIRNCAPVPTHDDKPADSELWRSQTVAGDSISRPVGHRCHRVSSGPRGSRPPPLADCRSLRRLSRPADAVAGDGPAGSGSDAAARGAHEASRDSCQERSPRPPARRARAAGRRAVRHGARSDRRARGRRLVWGRSLSRPEDRVVPGSARDPHRGVAVRAGPLSGCVQLQRRVRARACAALRRGDRGRHLRGGRGAHQAERGSKWTRATSRPGP